MLSFHAIGLPALAIDGQVVTRGRVLTPEEIKPLLEKPDVQCSLVLEGSSPNSLR